MLQSDTATAAGFSRVALNQVGIDRETGTGAIAGRNFTHCGKTVLVGHRTACRIRVGSTHDQQTATVGGDRRIGALVEQDRVVLDVTVLDKSDVRETRTISGTQVSAYPVVVELVIIGTVAECHSTGASRRRGKQFVADRRIQRYRVVVDVDVQVVAVRQALASNRTALAGPGRNDVGISYELQIHVFTLTDSDAARQSPGIVVNPVVGDLDIVSPAVDEDAATTLGTVADAQSVNTRRVAGKVRGIRIVVTGRVQTIRCCERHTTSWERRLCAAAEYICRAGRDVNAFG